MFLDASTAETGAFERVWDACPVGTGPAGMTPRSRSYMPTFEAMKRREMLSCNLHVGGGSVFATAGFANPTYAIVQLALRLGDHLGTRLAIGSAAASGG